MESLQIPTATSLPFLGTSTVMRSLIASLPTIAEARRTTLISGPTGSGKEVVARLLHAHGRPARAPCVAVHCGALPENLVEAELFGHTRGAFTGATQPRDGLIRAATGGTLFLDEVDSLSLGVQAKLLRFLESGEYRPVGSDRLGHSDTWVIAATNRDLKESVEQGRFRADLMYRLDVFHIHLPPLALRGGDIDLLARHFLNAVGGEGRDFTPGALAALRAYPWPGNVRELKHRIERAVLLTTERWIDAAALELDEEPCPAPPPVVHSPDTLRHELWSLIERNGLTLGEALAYCERSILQAALAAEGDNRTRAAHRLGIHLRTIFKKLRER